MADTCWKCGVRSDLGCRHKAAIGELPISLRPSKDKPVNISGGGRYNIQKIKSDA